MNQELLLQTDPWMDEVNGIYGRLQRIMANWLHPFAAEEEGDGEGGGGIPLSAGTLRRIGLNDLGKLCESLCEAAYAVKIQLFSRRESVESARRYFLELSGGQEGSAETESLPLHPSLAPERGEADGAQTFFDLLLMQTALMHVRLTSDYKLAPHLQESVYRYFLQMALNPETAAPGGGEPRADRPALAEPAVEPEPADAVTNAADAAADTAAAGEAEPPEQSESQELPEPTADEDNPADELRGTLEELDMLLNRFYRTTPALRTALKPLKADLWEVQLHVEDGGNGERAALLKLLDSLLALPCESADDANRLMQLARVLLRSAN